MSESNSIALKKIINSIQWNDQGLIPAIAQNEKDHTVLMLAWVNQQALLKSIKTNLATYYSRSRNKIWVKGEQSGNFQQIKKIYLDCDLDSVLFIVNQTNNIACHTNRKNCFFHQLSEDKKSFRINQKNLNEKNE